MIELIITVAVALVCLYGVVKLNSLYRKTDDLRYIVFLVILLLVFTDTWISFYGQNVSAFFTRYRFLFTFIPLAVYGIYAYLDKKRRREQQEKMKIKQAFSQYVMPALIEEILKDPSKLKLGGDKRYITIMFSDIRGFTTLSEKLSPEQLVEVMNMYLTRMTDIILENRGTVDKYIGDAIMAFWGAPIPEPEQKRLAVRTAIEMKHALVEVNKDLKDRGLPAIDIGVGINSGDVIVGNMGSDKRFNYTALGDHVNLASRLEGLNKFYHSNIIISEFVYDDVADMFVCRDLDLVKVKGKTQPVKIFEVLLKKDKVVDKKLQFYNKGLDLYRKGKFEEAELYFKRCLDVEEDSLCRLYIERCEHFMKHPPVKWDGVTAMTEK